MRLPFTAVLTACIDPSGAATASKLARRNPSERLADYRASLSHWLSLDDARLTGLVFVENSGYPLEALERMASEHNPHGRKLEFIRAGPNFVPDGVSYGYAELDMLDRVVTDSRLVAETGYFAKATGRLTFKGLTRLLDRLPDAFGCALDSRDNTRFVPMPQRFVTTQLMVFHRDFYRDHLLGVNRRLTPEMPLIENLLWETLLPMRGEPGVVLRWPVNVEPAGQAAHWNKSYHSPKHRAINFARAVMRRAAPNWWV